MILNVLMISAFYSVTAYAILAAIFLWRSQEDRDAMFCLHIIGIILMGFLVAVLPTAYLLSHCVK
jgi:hypothetical protein